MRDQAIDGFQPTVGKIKISFFINFHLFIYLFFTFSTLPLRTWTCRSLTDTGAGEPIESCRLHGYICGIPTYWLVGRFHSMYLLEGTSIIPDAVHQDAIFGKLLELMDQTTHRGWSPSLTLLFLCPLPHNVHSNICAMGEVMRHLSEESELVRDSVASCGETRFPYTA